MANWWNNYPWRVIQPNFREIDTKDFDENRFIEELKSFFCTMVMLNAAGLIASYPTKLEDHVTSPYLEGFDLKHLVERCHEEGIKVIARTDFSKIPEQVAERHPDWVYRHADGTWLNYNGYVQTCLLGGYQGAYMDEILKEMFAEIPFDGMYCNMGSATGYIVDYSMKRHGPCQCDACKAAFKAKTGMDVPVDLKPGDRASMVYFGFQQQIASAQKKRVTQLLRQINPDLAYCSIDYGRQEVHTDYLEALPAWQYMASSNARAQRGMGIESTIVNVDFMGFAYRHTSCSGPLQELRLWQGISNFSGIDYYVMGRLYDKEDQSTFDRVKRIFRYAAEHENETVGVDSVADVLLVRDSYVIPNKEERGWIRILTESHILFDETLPAGLAKKELGAYKAVILPEKMRLQSPVIEKLEAYVSEGGTVITTGMVPAMVCLGLSGSMKKNSDIKGSMFRIRPEDKKQFPSFEKRNLLIAGNAVMEASYSEKTELYGVYLEPERFGPPELCYPDKAPTAFPAAARTPYGKGCGIVIPWYPGEAYYEDGHEAFRLFAADLLGSLAHVSPVECNLSPMVEITRGKKDDFEIIHLVNGTGHFGNSYFDPPVLADQQVTIPWEGEIESVTNLDQEDGVTFHLEEGKLTLMVPKLGYHAGILIRKKA